MEMKLDGVIEREGMMLFGEATADSLRDCTSGQYTSGRTIGAKSKRNLTGCRRAGS
jgi:hypothetical protein